MLLRHQDLREELSMTDQEQINALKAQVNCLREFLLDEKHSCVYDHWKGFHHKVLDLLDKTPEQCLAEVKAKAIEEYKKERAETMRIDLATKIMMIS